MPVKTAIKYISQAHGTWIVEIIGGNFGNLGHFVSRPETAQLVFGDH